MHRFSYLQDMLDDARDIGTMNFMNFADRRRVSRNNRNFPLTAIEKESQNLKNILPREEFDLLFLYRRHRTRYNREKLNFSF